MSPPTATAHPSDDPTADPTTDPPADPTGDPAADPTGDRAAEPTLLRLPATAPFDFAASLRFLRDFPATRGEQDVTDTAVTLALREAGRTVGARLTAGAEGVDVVLTAAGPLDAPVLAAVADRLTFRFGLRDPVGELAELAADDPPFAAVVARLRGYHQVKFPSPLELLCWAILAQRVPMPVARSMKAALVDHFANTVVVDAATFTAFPDLDQLSTLDEPGFAALVGNARKARYLHGAVLGYAAIGEPALRERPFDEVRERLLALPGIGPWSANFLLVRGLGRVEGMTPDPAALRAATQVYGRPIDADEFTRLGERYGPWQGYWGHYLRVAGPPPTRP